MTLTNKNWKNKRGTGDRMCSCGSWAQHWVNFSQESWPAKCFVKGCHNRPVLGAHVYNPDEHGEWIIPMCSSCNKRVDAFDIEEMVTLVSANTKKTCNK